MNYDVPSLAREVATRDQCDFFTAALGWIPDPDLILRRLGLDAREYNDLLDDSQVCAALARRKAKNFAKKWSIEKNGSDPQLFEEVQRIFDRLKVRRIMSEILDAVFFGYQPLEITWENREGKIVPKDVIGKPAWWFRFDSKNKLILRTKENFVGHALPERKFLLAQSDATADNPYGRRIASQVFWYVIFKKCGMKWWVTFLEKFGMPWVLGKLPRGYTKQESDELLSMLSRMVRDAIAVTPENASIELLSVTTSPKSGTRAASGGSREGAKPEESRDDSGGNPNMQSLHLPLINYCDGAIAKAFLGHASALDTWDGKFGGKDTIDGAIDDLADADASMVCGVFDDLIGMYAEVNYGMGTARANKPRFILQSKKSALRLDQALRDKDLALSCKAKFTKEYYQKTYGFADDDIVMVQPGPKPPTVLSEKTTGIILPPMRLDSQMESHNARPE